MFLARHSLHIITNRFFKYEICIYYKEKFRRKKYIKSFACNVLIKSLHCGTRSHSICRIKQFPRCVITNFHVKMCSFKFERRIIFLFIILKSVFLRILLLFFWCFSLRLTTNIHRFCWGCNVLSFTQSLYYVCEYF